MGEPNHRNPNMKRRVSASGRVYYINLDTLKKKSTRKKDVPPFMHSKDDPYYLAYFERKQKIKSEYPFWHKMTQVEWRDYYNRIYTLMQTDEDYLHWINVTNETERQKANRGRLERKIQRNEANRNGYTYDEY